MIYQHDCVDLAQLLLDCRWRIAEAYFHGEPKAALEAVAEASMALAPLVAEGELLSAPAWDTLQAVSENLGLVARYNQDIIQTAIAYGPQAYAAHRQAIAEIARAA